MKPPTPMWQRTLIEAGKTSVFLASFVLFGIFVKGVVELQPGALIVLGMLLTVAVSVLHGYVQVFREWRHREHT